MAARITNYTKIVKSFLIGNFFVDLLRKYLTGTKRPMGGKYVHIFIWYVSHCRKRYVHILCLFFVTIFPY